MRFLISTPPPETTHLADNPWFAIGLPLGIALIGLASTIVVLSVQTRSRAKEIRDERAAALGRESRDREEDLRRERTDAYEEIVSEIAKYSEAMNATTKGKRPGQGITFPPQAQLRRSLAKLTTRMHVPELFTASLDCLNYAPNLPAEQFVGVLGALHERLDFWFLGRRTLDETLEVLRADVECYKQGKLPPFDGPLPPDAERVFGTMEE